MFSIIFYKIAYIKTMHMTVEPTYTSIESQPFCNSVLFTVSVLLCSAVLAVASADTSPWGQCWTVWRGCSSIHPCVVRLYTAPAGQMQQSICLHGILWAHAKVNQAAGPPAMCRHKERTSGLMWANVPGLTPCSGLLAIRVHQRNAVRNNNWQQLLSFSYHFLKSKSSLLLSCIQYIIVMF